MGWRYEDGVLGRLLIPSPLLPLLPYQISYMESTSGGRSWVGEFFTDQSPIKASVDADKNTIWRVSLTFGVYFPNDYSPPPPSLFVTYSLQVAAELREKKIRIDVYLAAHN